jgi:hypothetical protein
MKTRNSPDLPGSIKEIFENKEVEYRVDHAYSEPEMDNVESLRWFIDYVDIKADYIEEDGGTQLILTHPDFDFKLVVDSCGGGDMHSHRFEVSLFKN